MFYWQVLLLVIVLRWLLCGWWRSVILPLFRAKLFSGKVGSHEIWNFIPPWQKFLGWFKNISMKFCFTILILHGSHRSYPSRGRACCFIRLPPPPKKREENNCMSPPLCVFLTPSLSGSPTPVNIFCKKIICQGKDCQLFQLFLSPVWKCPTNCDHMVVYCPHLPI